MVLEVAYDLHNPGRDYAAVASQLKSADSWAHPQGSVWIIDTLRDPTWWVEQLKGSGDANDEYVVTRIQDREWASYRMDSDVATWLKSSSRRW